MSACALASERRPLAERSLQKSPAGTIFRVTTEYLKVKNLGGTVHFAPRMAFLLFGVLFLIIILEEYKNEA